MNTKTFCVACKIMILMMLVGCGKNVRVTGIVKFDDGKPLNTGTVVMQKGGEAMQGAITADGSFAMGVIRDGQGIPPGVYKVAVTGAQTEPGIFLIDQKYADPDRSGLTFEVVKGQNNHCEITVSPPAK